MSKTKSPPAGSDLRLYLRLLRQARPYWRHVLALLALSLLATPIALLQPLPLKLAVDSVIGTQPLPDVVRTVSPGLTPGSGTVLLLVAITIVVVAFLSHVQEMASAVLRAYTGDRLTIAFRADLF